MSKIAYLACAGVLALLCSTGRTAARKEDGPFTLHIADDSPPHHVGADIFIWITQDNTSARTVNCSSWYAASTNLTYHYVIKNSRGSVLRPRADAMNVPGSTDFCTLQPGKSLKGEYLISWLYDLRAAGSYTVQVSRTVGNSSHQVVESNAITISVTK